MLVVALHVVDDHVVHVEVLHEPEYDARGPVLDVVRSRLKLLGKPVEQSVEAVERGID